MKQLRPRRTGEEMKGGKMWVCPSDVSIILWAPRISCVDSMADVLFLVLVRSFVIFGPLIA